MKAANVLKTFRDAKPGSSFKLTFNFETFWQAESLMDHFLRRAQVLQLDARYESKDLVFWAYPTGLCNERTLQEIAERLAPYLDKVEVIQPPTDIKISLHFPQKGADVYTLCVASKTPALASESLARIAFIVLNEMSQKNAILRLERSVRYGCYGWDYLIGDEDQILAHAEAVAKRFGVTLQMGEEKKR